MKSIVALKLLEKLPSTVRWFTLNFDCWVSASEFCTKCFGDEAIIVQMNSLSGRIVLVTTEPLKRWVEDAPIYDAVVFDPDGFKLNDVYIYMLDD